MRWEKELAELSLGVPALPGVLCRGAEVLEQPQAPFSDVVSFFFFCGSQLMSFAKLRVAQGHHFMHDLVNCARKDTAK